MKGTGTVCQATPRPPESPEINRPGNPGAERILP